MLTSLGSIAAQQSNPIDEMMKKLNLLLDYAATHTDAVITYHPSEMVLAGPINALCLFETKSRSRASVNFFMSDSTEFPPNNGEVLTIAKVIKAVMSSTAEDGL